MLVVLAVHLAAALTAFVTGRSMGRRALVVGALGPLSTVALLVVWAIGGDRVETVAWVPALSMDLAFRVDGLAALMLALVGGIGVLVFFYARHYFSERPDLGRFSAYLTLFAGSMAGLVTADNVLLIFIFWELTSVTSYLLIAFEDEEAVARSSALQALLVTGLGGLAMLAGLVLLGQAGGTFLLSELLAAPPTGGVVPAALVLVLAGAVTKSAQFPFHFWLPGAMAAPTPVSAYLHSATMVKAGIYLVARIAPVYALLIDWWRPSLALIGVVTMLVGGWSALTQYDMKLLLAQGTVSQLGFMMVLVGMGVPELTFAGMAVILGHAAFKGTLFMVAGIIDHQAHTRDLRRLTGLFEKMPAVFWLSVTAVASMAGLPPLLGFVAKEAALEALVHTGWAVTAAVVAGSALTVAYGIRFLVGVFSSTDPEDRINPVGDEVGAPEVVFLVPVVVLTVATVAGGLFPDLFDPLVSAAALSVDPTVEGQLLLWHGFGLPLGLSAVALAAGYVMWRRPSQRLRRLTGSLPEASHFYERSITGVNRLADNVTSTLQSGSLPAYLVVIFSVAVVAPLTYLVTNWQAPSGLIVAEHPVQAVAAIIVIVAALGTTWATRRLGAVLFMGAVGYGVAVLFVIQGAPDLALTQLLIETLTLALFVFVLMRLPTHFETLVTRLRRVVRIGVSVAAGVGAMLLAVWAYSGRVAPSLAPEFLERAGPEGGGSNVVNVILTDIRALDTLGEITVLALAAMGAVALVKARLRRGDEPEADA